MRRHGYVAFYTAVAVVVAAMNISAPSKADVILTPSDTSDGGGYFESPGVATTVSAAPVGTSAPGMFYNPAVSSASAPVGEFYDLALNPPIVGVSGVSAPIGEFYDLALNPPITTDRKSVV